MIDYCWAHVPEYSIFTVPRLSWDKKEQLMEEDILKIANIPESFPLSDIQQEYVDCVQGGETTINWAGIREELAQLEYPLYFLDFETDNPAIPRFEGMHPYEKFPFQYSCHLLQSDGTLEHTEYLHPDQTDPRRPVAEHLTDDIGETGSIITYNVGFEKSIIAQLQDRFSEHRDALQSMIDRLWDQLIIFREYYTDHRFKGSNSMKSVLPVLVPELTYDDLEVQGGDIAQVVWNEMIESEDETQRDKLTHNLLEYCKRDTLGIITVSFKVFIKKYENSSYRNHFDFVPLDSPPYN